MKTLRKASFALSALVLMVVMSLSLSGFATNIATSTDMNSKSVDLSTAFRMASAEALNWNSNAMVLYASSTDSDFSDITQGTDGKRQSWTFSFVVENQDVILNVLIAGGNIELEEVDSGFNSDWLFPIIDFEIGSREAVRTVRTKFGLLPSPNWAVGYHFTLTNIDGGIYIGVVGTSPNGTFTRYHINVFTGTPFEQIPTTLLVSDNVQTAGIQAAVSPLWFPNPIEGHHHVFNQNATAYVAPSGARGASGIIMSIGMVAVHPRTHSPINSVAVGSGPVIPFGTTITLDRQITFANGLRISQFVVQDLGQLNNQSGFSRHWIDVFFGVNNNTNLQAALAFGSQRFSYTWTGLRFL